MNFTMVMNLIMKIKKFRYFVGDFETTVFKGQTYTEVWASAVVELFSNNVVLHHSISETFDYLTSLNENIVIYYHNLKFDGSFWLSYLITELNLEQAYQQDKTNPEMARGEWINDRNMKNKSFKYSISDKGQWYNIIIKWNNHFIEIRDSLKLLPFSVKRIGEGFKTKHRKLDMKYTGFRYAGCTITPEEEKYIKNDVLVVKEALEVMFKEGHNKLTIGACCLEEYKTTIDKEDYTWMFPDLTAIELDSKIYKYNNADEYIRNSYKGGWCYVVKGKTNQVKRHGTTADVNSLYPSMMSSKSGNRFPFGKPCFWSGNYIPDEALRDNVYYFVRIKTKFQIKKDYLPFIQIKGSIIYKGTECLETSDFYNKKTGKYQKTYTDDFGLQDTSVELVLTMTDYELIKEHYELYDFEILDGCWFYSLVGIFDEYIDKYAQLKMTSKGALRELAKLFLNNLYGKLATNSNSSFKVAYKKEDGSIGFYTVIENNKKVGYIACGSAITSYARNFTIRAAQKNYHGVDKPGFIYADTDSIHCDLPPEEITGIDVDDVHFCCWKLESCWDEAIFTRQKTYIEHVTHENLNPIKHPYYNVKCAGMPNKCKDLFVTSMSTEANTENTQVDFTNKDELKFLSTRRNLTDFKIGLKVPGKLRPVRIKGGILLVDTTYEMR